jgi:hypothetical protein
MSWLVRMSPPEFIEMARPVKMARNDSRNWQSERLRLQAMDGVQALCFD